MVHPRDHEGFEWNENIEAHLAAHAIKFWEVEELFFNCEHWLKDREGEPGDFFMIGKTDAGRKLTIVVCTNEVNLLLKVITGWDSDKEERAKYFNE